MPTRIQIRLKNGLMLTKEKSDYEGFQTHPMQWKTVVEKFEQLSQAHLPRSLQDEIEDAVLHLGSIQVREFTTLLGKIK
jgi:2-methylcitrate dehydratase